MIKLMSLRKQVTGRCINLTKNPGVRQVLFLVAQPTTQDIHI
jgi:hypothetical protein